MAYFRVGVGGNADIFKTDMFDIRDANGGTVTFNNLVIGEKYMLLCVGNSNVATYTISGATSECVPLPLHAYSSYVNTKVLIIIPTSTSVSITGLSTRSIIALSSPLKTASHSAYNFFSCSPTTSVVGDISFEKRAGNNNFRIDNGTDITCLVAGTYSIDVGIACHTNNANQTLIVKKNGTEIGRCTTNGNNGYSLTLNNIPLSVGDVITMNPSNVAIHPQLVIIFD